LYNTFNEDYIDIDEQSFSTNLIEHYAGVFTEADFYINKKFVTRIGARLEHSDLLNKWNIAPRLSMAYKIGEKSQISLAYGQFYQTPEKELLRYNQSIDFERADHYMLNYQVIKNKRTFRVEAYYKKYDELVKYDLQSPWLSNNLGDGYAKGIDVFFRDQHTIKNGDFWLSYSYLDTQRDYRDFPIASTPSFASKHNMSFVYKHFLSKINTAVGFTYSFGSGRPYNDPNESTFNNGMTKPYQDLSFNASYLTNIFGQFTVVYLSVNNVLGFENNFGYRFSNTPSEDGTFASSPIEPAAKRFFFVGCFISIGQNYNDQEVSNN